MSEALWIFGYGSLIWNPDFAVAEQRLAEAQGWRRSFCMSSVHYRGTHADPGLVLALEAAPEACCQGVALRVSPGHEAETLARLRARELVSSAYLEERISLQTAEGVVEAVVYVIAPGHVQHWQGLSLEEQAQIIARAEGERGPNRDYLWATVAQLEALGIADPDLSWLSDRVRALCAGMHQG